MEAKPDNAKLNYEKLGGDGPPIVMVHGWGHSIDSLRPLGELLSRRMQVYLVDLPGFGASAALDSEAGTREYADALIGFLDSLALDRVTLLGHSFGGQVSIRVAAAHPERIAKLVLIGCAGLRREQAGTERSRFQAIGILRNGVKWLDRTLGTKFYESWFIPRFGSPDYVAAGKLRPLLVKAISEDLSAEAREIRCPTLLLWGEKDTATPVSNGRRLKDLIQASRLVELPGKGHLLFAGTGAHLCAYYLRPFLFGETTTLEAVSGA